MRIGLNLLFLKPGVVGGTQTYAEGLLSALAGIGANHTFFLYMNRESRELFGGLPPNFEPVICRVPGTIRPLRVMYEQAVLPLLLRKHQVEVLHSLGQTTPAILPCPSVITVFDTNYWSLPGFFPFTERVFARPFVRQALASSSRVIAISGFTKRELETRLNVAPETITVIHLGCRFEAQGLPPGGEEIDAQILTKYGVTPPYILTVASPWPHKNVAGLIAAYRELCPTREGHSLVIAGRSVEHIPAVRAELEKTGNSGEVVFTGYVADNDLPALYRNASAFAFPSLYEGFGLPVLEAMSYGLPIVSSDAAALPEIGGDAVLYADPRDPAAFAAQIRRILDDGSLREALAARGRERVAEFTWEKTARETLKLYEEIARR